MPVELLIVGASARAAVHSACRAGLIVAATDCFGDLDLCATCPARRVDHYPKGFLRVQPVLAGVPWLYTGGMENHPGIIERMSRQGPLWGNHADVLRSVRDTFQLAAALGRVGIAMPKMLRPSQLRDTRDKAPTTWLLKPRYSSGGRHVRRFFGARDLGGHRPFYLQRFVAGDPCSALMLMSRGEAVVLGETSQLVSPEKVKTSFKYRGSIGPWRVAGVDQEVWQRIGDCLARHFGLRGLIGVDAIRDADGRLWPLEVNPRYVASCELYDLAWSISTVGLHIEACRQGKLPIGLPQTESSVILGKGIVYSPCDGRMSEPLLSRANDLIAADDVMGLADVPPPGTPLTIGHPVMTVLARRDDGQFEPLRHRMHSLVNSLENLIAEFTRC